MTKEEMIGNLAATVGTHAQSLAMLTEYESAGMLLRASVLICADETNPAIGSLLENALASAEQEGAQHIIKYAQKIVASIQ